MLNRVVARALAFVFSVSALAVCISLQAAPAAKKLIEYGWDVPNPEFVRDHIRDMERRPFDGLIMRNATGGGQAFEPKPWDAAAMAKETQVLADIKWQKFTDNFLMLFSASTMDWFSDADWAVITSNLGLVARAAKAGHCKGLVFDAEPYGDNPWSYATQRHAKDKSFAEYQAVARRRGAQFMDAMQKELPDLRLLTFYQLSLFPGLAQERDAAKREKMLQGEAYGLLPAFLNGWLDAAGPRVVITDGNEPSYYYTKPQQFTDVARYIREGALSLVAPENVGKYRKHVQVSQALYIDYVFKYWDRTYIASGLTPEERAKWFEHNVYNALDTADEYVWCYSERMNWWKSDNIPFGCQRAIVSARRKIAAGEPLGFDLANTFSAADKRVRAEVRAKITTRSADITRLSQGEAPKCDGKLDDSVWQRLQPLAPFVGYLDAANAAKPVAGTRAWAAYDDKYLYLACKCDEPTIKDLRISGTERDSSIWEGDSVDFFLAPGVGVVPYYHLILNPNNVQWDAVCTDATTGANDLSFNPQWQSVTNVGDKAWTAEIAIPWASLKLPAPRPGSVMRANFCRQRIPGGEQTSWSQCVSGFVEPESFGTWRFGG